MDSSGASWRGSGLLPLLDYLLRSLSIRTPGVVVAFGLSIMNVATGSMGGWLSCHGFPCLCSVCRTVS